MCLQPTVVKPTLPYLQTPGHSSSKDSSVEEALCPLTDPQVLISHPDQEIHQLTMITSPSIQTQPYTEMVCNITCNPKKDSYET